MTIQTPAKSVRPIPEGYHTLTPALIVNNAAAAIEFYKRGFGAEELGRMSAPDGQKVFHAEIRIGDSKVMLADEFPEMGDCLSPTSIGGTASSLHIYVEDADAVFQRAVEAGATVAMPLMDAFWGDRFGKLIDPFGHHWSIATHIEDVTEEEMHRRAVAFSSNCAQG